MTLYHSAKREPTAIEETDLFGIRCHECGLKLDARREAAGEHRKVCPGKRRKER